MFFTRLAARVGSALRQKRVMTTETKNVLGVFLLYGVPVLVLTTAVGAMAQLDSPQRTWGDQYSYRRSTGPATNVDVNAVKECILDAIEAEDIRRMDGTSIGPTLVRLAWHSAGTYNRANGTGGSHGACMRYGPEGDWPVNKGLEVARTFMNRIKAKHPNMSYADLYTLGGAVAIENAGGPVIAWDSGRADASPLEALKHCVKGQDRLPDADKGNPKETIEHIRDVFYRQGFNDREAVALIGAHALGRCHEENTGYEGPWTYSEISFSNQFFKLLIEETWKMKTTRNNGKPWEGNLQYENEDHTLMMLPSDIALLSDPTFRGVVGEYAEDEKLFFKDFANAFAKLLNNGSGIEDHWDQFGLGFHGWDDFLGL